VTTYLTHAGTATATTAAVLPGIQSQPAPTSDFSPHDCQPGTVLVVDPAGTFTAALRPGLTQYAGCRIVQARSAADVQDLLSHGVVGDLAMVSVQFHDYHRKVIPALRNAGWTRIIALTTAAGPPAPIIDAIQAGAGGVLRFPCWEPDPQSPAHRLTPRELEIVRLVADGRTNKAIGAKLSLSALTVKNHLARIGRKLGTGDRAQIVAIACRGGVIHNPRDPVDNTHRSLLTGAMSDTD